MEARDGSSLHDVTTTDSGRVVTLNRNTTVFPIRPTHPQRCRLSASDLEMLGCHYIQKGLLFRLPAPHTFDSTVNRLKTSLAEVLVQFFPLAGRLITSEADGAVYVDCNDRGVGFIEASALADIDLAQLQTDDVSPVVRQLFALDGALNFDITIS